VKDKLLQLVEDRFEVRGRGLVVATLPVRPDRAFPFTADVDVVTPTGDRRPAVALFSIPMGGRASKSACSVLLRDLGKDDVPIGSRVFADAITATSFLVDG
jgi:hypothetical protein